MAVVALVEVVVFPNPEKPDVTITAITTRMKIADSRGKGFSSASSRSRVAIFASSDQQSGQASGFGRGCDHAFRLVSALLVTSSSVITCGFSRSFDREEPSRKGT